MEPKRRKISTSTQYEETSIAEEISLLANSYSILVEIDGELLPEVQKNRLNKAKSRLIRVIVNYIYALPEIEEEKGDP